MRATLTRLFELDVRGTTIARETRGAVATFLTMAYILFANPGILAAAGVPFEGAAAATAAATAICSILMGVIGNVPIALAPGMGLNAVIAFQVAAATGSWQAAMALVVVEGGLVLALVLLGWREAVMDAIPLDLRRAIGVGIGLFIAFIGAVDARLVVVPRGTISTLATNPSAVLPPVTAGSIRTPETVIALAGVLVIAILFARRRAGAILIGIAAATSVALAAGVAHLPSRASAGGGVAHAPAIHHGLPGRLPEHRHAGGRPARAVPGHGGLLRHHRHRHRYRRGGAPARCAGAAPPVAQRAGGRRDQCLDRGPVRRQLRHVLHRVRGRGRRGRAHRATP
jgi:xanthine/uracil/vitamin C permease (AzgA family)